MVTSHSYEEAPSNCKRALQSKASPWADAPTAAPTHIPFCCPDSYSFLLPGLLFLSAARTGVQRNAHVVTIDDYEDVPSNCERDLQKAVAAQPVSVAIEADKRDFQFYSSVSLVTQQPQLQVGGHKA